MKVGVIGLGRMGQSIVARLLHAGIDAVGYDAYPVVLELTLPPPAHKHICMATEPSHNTQKIREGHFIMAKTVAELAQQSSAVWLMVPAGDTVDTVLKELIPHLKKGTPIIDGGNSFFKDTVQRARWLQEQGYPFLDCGTSGGLQGRSLGFCLMVGGPVESYRQLEYIFKILAAPQGYGYMGPSGAGHYVKMVHNGIEYGLLEAYGEGFQLLKEGSYPSLDLAAISKLWNQGSIIRSWLLVLAHDILQHDQDFKSISGAVGESGTGQWTVTEAQEQGVEVPVIAQALHIRAQSRTTGGSYATKLVALLRHAFGGHAVVRKGEDKHA
jgi:6-phosphogluconate dehydrogenase